MNFESYYRVGDRVKCVNIPQHNREQGTVTKIKPSCFWFYGQLAPVYWIEARLDSGEIVKGRDDYFQKISEGEVQK